MHVKQKLSILFYLKRKKATKEGIPIYVRITVDGLQDEFSLGFKVKAADWDNKNKLIYDTHPQHKMINDKINDTRTDLSRHFLLVQARENLATPEAIKTSYFTPINGANLQHQKVENLLFRETMEQLITDYIKYCEKIRRLQERTVPLPIEKKAVLAQEEKKLGDRIKALSKTAFSIFDDKDRIKTFLLALDEFMFNFLVQVYTGKRAYTTLEKWMGRRKRYTDFIIYRYKKDDLPLTEMQYSLMDELVNYCKLIHEVNDNTAMYYAKCLKEVISRAVSKGWIRYNIFDNFKCSFTDPVPAWLPMPQMIRLKNHNFKKEHLNVIRDIYVFACFTGLSYTELRKLAPFHIIPGKDGEMWINIKRQKTKGPESLPMLPIAVEIMEKFKTHTLCLRKDRILPMPTNEHWNRCLKEIGKEMGIDVLMQHTKLKGHQTRYFFANEVAYDNGIEVIAIKQMLSHKKMSTTEYYLRGNKNRISQNMQELKKTLFNTEGKLRIEENMQCVNPSIETGNLLRVAHKR